MGPLYNVAAFGFFKMLTLLKIDKHIDMPL